MSVPCQQSSGNSEPMVNVKKGKSSTKMSKEFLCDICNVKVSSEKNLLSHQQGKKHENRLKKQQLKNAYRNQLSTPSEKTKPTENASKKSHQQQGPFTIHVNLDMSNEGNKNYSQRDKHFRQKSKSWGNHSNNYNYNEHVPNRSQQPYQTDFRHHNDQHFHGEPWKFGNKPKWSNDRYPPPYYKGDRYVPGTYSKYNQPHYDNDSPAFSGDNGEYPEPKSNKNDPGNKDSVSPNDGKEDLTPGEGKSIPKSHNSKIDKINSGARSVKDNVRHLAKVKPFRAYKTDAPCTDTQRTSSDQNQAKYAGLTENMTGKRIAHWINPLNQKDEAEVRQLVTQFTKSRQKENLLKLKQQSESPTSREDISDEVVDAMDSIISDSHINDSTLAGNSQSLKNILESFAIPKTSHRNRLSSDCLSNSSSKGIPIVQSPSMSGTSKKSSNKSSSPGTDLGKKKRKSSVEQESAVKKKFSSSKDLEDSINAAVENGPPEWSEYIKTKKKKQKTNTIGSESFQNESNDIGTTLNTPEASSQKETLQQVRVPCIKKEPLEVIDQPQVQDFLASLNLSGLVEHQSNPENNPLANGTMTPVESLIDLFASGNFKVKKEYDDPVIDAISTVDPAILDTVCSGQFNSGTKINTQSPDVSNTINVPSVTVSLKNILNELQTISAEEEKVKNNIREADRKMHEFQLLLDEWKTKKMTFQNEEEILRNQRNILVKSMNDLVTQQSMEISIILKTENMSVPSSDTTSLISNPMNKHLTTEKFSNNNQLDTTKINADKSTSNSGTTKNQGSEQEGDIDILPVKSKLAKSDILVVDLDEIEPNTDEIVIDNDHVSIVEGLFDNMPNMKDFHAHKAVVNSIQVFEEFLYTCSNDSTAKRFDLKDLSKIVTYQHEKKNVTQLCLDKYRSKTLVYTICSPSNVVFLFNGEDGTILKIINLLANVASICKGKESIYAGCRNGAIFTCHWKKDYIEIVNVGEPIRSMAWTHQGCLSVLVTLSTAGSVSIRDADRNGLLIRNVKPVMAVPLLMRVHSDSIYLSGSGIMVVIEIATGNCVRKYELSSPYTSLAVYQSYIFTAAFSGLVRCYSKEEQNEVKVYYGAGSSLTCINVHHGWVFTGNRFGAVDVFKFQPNSTLPCQFGNCDLIFSRPEDLEKHVLEGKDHDLPAKGSICPWRPCSTKILKNLNRESIECHLKIHLYEYNCDEVKDSHLPIYNLSF